MQQQLNLFEEWRPIPDWERFYSASSLGRIRRDARKGADCTGSYTGARAVPRILKSSLAPNRYPVVTLHACGKKKMATVHSLVAVAFLGPRPEAREVNHKDASKTNNRTTNLEYITPSANIRHNYTPDRRPTRVAAQKLTADQVLAIRAHNGKPAEIAVLYGITTSNVWLIRTRKSWRHI